MRDKVKEFLTDTYIQKLILNNKWDQIYNEEVIKYNFYPRDKGDLTLTLLASGIDPLNYFAYKIPEDYSYNIPSGIKTMEEIIIPEGIKEICLGAFCQNKSLKKVNLPKSLSYINRVAFYECDNLEEINYNSTVKEWKRVGEEDEQTFYGVYTKVIHCTDGDYPIRTDKDY